MMIDTCNPVLRPIYVLQLPSLCVLQLAPTATIKPAHNLTLKNTSTFTGLVSLWDVHFSAVMGGTIDASSLPAAAMDYPYANGYMAVAIKGGGNNAVRHLRAAANNSDGALGIHQSPNSEVFCTPVVVCTPIRDLVCPWKRFFYRPPVSGSNCPFPLVEFWTGLAPPFLFCFFVGIFFL